MSETWEAVANAMITHLTTSSEIKNASNGYPRSDIAESDLTYAVLMPPQMDYGNLSFASFQITYNLTLNIHVLKIADNQEWLLESDINTCANKAHAIYSYLKTNSTVAVNTTKAVIMLGNAKIAKFTPSTQANRGKYAGIAMDISLKV